MYRKSEHLTKYSNIGIARDRNPVAFFTGLGKTSTKKMLLKYEFFPKGGGGPGRTKSFEALFFCPEAIKIKQITMCQKAKNVKNFFLKFLFNNFGKSEKSASKIPKVRKK